MVRASELSTKFLGITLPAPAKPAAPASPVATDGAPAADATPAVAAPAEPSLTVDQRAKLARLQGDLMWLVREGYVTEFIDGRLFAPPPTAEARKKEVEGEEHDPENFPEAPVVALEAAAPTPEVAAPAPVDEAPTAPAAEEPKATA